MIIMINGAFGVGKTSVATKLRTLLPNCTIYDPEEVGAMLRTITNGILTELEATDDYQNIALWPDLVVDIGKRLHQQYGRSLIVPMTITNPTYFNTIRNGFAQIDEVQHYCLVANETQLRQRLLARGQEEGEWCFLQIPRCVTAFRSPLFARHIDTNGIDVDSVTNILLNQIQNSCK